MKVNKVKNEAKEITKKLEEYNQERQSIEKRIYTEALEQLKDEEEAKKDSIVLVSHNWHHGVIGIVASKLTEQFYKPSILLSIEDGEVKGSGRSIPGFDLHEALCKTSEYLEKFGGHEMAVGLTLKEANYDSFKKEFEKLVEEIYTIILSEKTDPMLLIYDVLRIVKFINGLEEVK